MLCKKCGRTYNEFRSVCVCGYSLIPGVQTQQSSINNSVSEFVVNPFKDGVEIVSYSSFNVPDLLQIPSVINGKLVRRIGKSAFAGRDFTEVTIPPCVLEIGEGAFCSCKKLKNVILSEGLIRIETKAFYVCQELDHLILPKSVEYIGEKMIDDTAIEFFNITRNVQKVPSSFCSLNKKIRNVTFEEGVKEIGCHAFFGTEIENVIIPQSVEKIGVRAFETVNIAFLGMNTKLDTGYTADWYPAISFDQDSNVFCRPGSVVLGFCSTHGLNVFPLEQYDNFIKEQAELKIRIAREKQIKLDSQTETIISYETEYGYKYQDILVGEQVVSREKSNEPIDKSLYEKLREINGIKNGTCIRPRGIEDGKVYAEFMWDNCIFSVNEFKKLEAHVKEVSHNYVNTRSEFVSNIKQFGDELYESEAGLIANNLIKATELDVFLSAEGVSQFDYKLEKMMGEIDYHLHDAFFLSSEIQKYTCLAKWIGRVEQKQLKKYKEKYHRSNPYHEFFENFHLKFTIDKFIENFYSDCFVKFSNYINQYYNSEIECISQKFINNEFQPLFADKNTICTYLVYYILKKAIFNLAIKEYGALVLENFGVSIQKHAELLRDKFEWGFVNARTMGMYVLALMQNGVFDSDDYIINYKTFEAEFNKLQQKSDIEKFREKFASGGVSKTYTIKDIDLMTGIEFENFLCDLFQKMGYHTLTTKASGDQGIDVIAEKDAMKIGIQAKCYTGTVGNSAIQEAVAGKTYYSCDKVMVITNSRFTKAAIDLAKANNVILWDRDMLKENI